MSVRVLDTHPSVTLGQPPVIIAQFTAHNFIEAQRKSRKYLIDQYTIVEFDDNV